MEKFERIKKWPGLYRRQYMTTSGERRFKYYARFTCKLKGKRRCEPLGSDERVAKTELQKILGANGSVRGEGKDFDTVNELTQGFTFRQWAEDYFANHVDPEKHAGGIDREKRSYRILEPFFGDMPLVDIKRPVIANYRMQRLQQAITRRGKVVMKDGKPVLVSFVTVNRELSFLRFLLNSAVDEEILEESPRFTSKRKNAGLIKSEKNRKRDRVASINEYEELLSNMKRPAQRVVVALFETAMRLNEAINLTWPLVDEKAGFIRLPASYVKEKATRNVPISENLKAVLAELRQEQKRVTNISNRVFTRAGRPIKSIRTAFDRSKKAAQIEDLNLHDLRQYRHNELGSGGYSTASHHGCGRSSFNSAKQRLHKSERRTPETGFQNGNGLATRATA